MQVSQTVSEEEARAYLMRATRLVNEGMMLDRRHYEKLRDMFRLYAHAFLPQKWFSEWLAIHRDAIVVHFSTTYNHEQRWREWVRERDERRLQRMLRRLRNG